MNYRDRNKLIATLIEEEHFGALASHRERVQYVLEHYRSFHKIRRTTKSNVDAARARAAKSLTKASLYKTEAEAPTRLAEQQDVTASDREDYLNQALQSYTWVCLFRFTI